MTCCGAEAADALNRCGRLISSAYEACEGWIHFGIGSPRTDVIMHQVVTHVTRKSIVLDVDPSSDGAAEALRWACDEAMRRDLTVLVVSMYPRAAGKPVGAWLVGAINAHDGVPTQYERERWQALAAVDAALCTIRTRYPSVGATGWVVEGDRAELLLGLSDEADLLVIGGPDNGNTTRSVTNLPRSFATRSTTPMVVCRARPDAETRSKREVVVGVDVTSTDDLPPVLAYGFEYARGHRASLRAVCCHLPRRVAFSDTALSTRRDVEVRLAQTIDIWQEIFPDVAVSHDVVAARPAEGLLSESQDAALLVVGMRSRSALGWRGRGRVVRHLLRRSRAPIAVVPVPTVATG